MRLLNVHSGELESFLERGRPLYGKRTRRKWKSSVMLFWLTSKQAILSHTWGNEEILFSDVKDGSYIVNHGQSQIWILQNIPRMPKNKRAGIRLLLDRHVIN